MKEKEKWDLKPGDVLVNFKEMEVLKITGEDPNYSIQMMNFDTISFNGHFYCSGGSDWAATLSWFPKDRDGVLFDKCKKIIEDVKPEVDSIIRRNKLYRHLKKDFFPQFEPFYNILHQSRPFEDHLEGEASLTEGYKFSIKEIAVIGIVEEIKMGNVFCTLYQIHDGEIRKHSQVIFSLQSKVWEKAKHISNRKFDEVIALVDKVRGRAHDILNCVEIGAND